MPIHFGGHLVGIAKLVAPPKTSKSAFDAATNVLKLVVSKTCLHLTVSELTEQVHALQQRVGGVEKIKSESDPLNTSAAQTKNHPGANDGNNQSILLVNRALAYLHAHYQNPALSLPEVAGVLDCNARYLTTRFTQVVGEHMHTHMLALRVAHACKLLIDTDLRVKEIAHASGFTSTSRLTATFRRYVGVSPVRYRHVFSGRA